MKTLNLNEYGVSELNQFQIIQVTGGLAAEATAAATACVALGTVGAAVAGAGAIIAAPFVAHEATEKALDTDTGKKVVNTIASWIYWVIY